MVRINFLGVLEFFFKTKKNQEFQGKFSLELLIFYESNVIYLFSFLGMYYLFKNIFIFLK